MKTIAYVLVAIASLIPLVGFADQQKSNRIAVVVNAYLSAEIKDSLDTYFNDLEHEHYEPILKEWSLEENPNPSELKAYLKGLYDGGGLGGAVFIGDLPVAMFEDPSAPDNKGPFPIDHYYMDLDSDEWKDTDGNGYFDKPVFTPENLRKRTIWVSRLKTSGIDVGGPRGLYGRAFGLRNFELGLIKSYFKKNHNFRTGVWLYGERHWKYIPSEWIEKAQSSGFYNAYITWNKKTDFFINDMPKLAFLKLLKDNVNEVAIWETHGSSSKIWVNSKKEMVASEELRELTFLTPFVIPISCWVGDYTASDYFTGLLLFAKNSEVLAVVAATIPIAVWPVDLFLYAFDLGSSFGESYLQYLSTNFLSWDQRRLQDERGRVLLGDGTLKRQRYILGEEADLDNEEPIAPRKLFKYIMPTSVLPLINTLRFNFSKKEIYWDPYYMRDGLTYRLSKKSKDGTGIIIYEGAETRAIDNDFHQGDVYYLEYVWNSSAGVIRSQKAVVVANVEDEVIGYATARKNTPLLKTILSLRDPKENPGETSVFGAIYSGKLESLALVLMYGASLNIVNANGDTPLQLVVVLANKDWKGMVDVLLAAGANIDEKNPKNGATALIFAVEENHLDIAEYLIQRGANTEIKDNSGKTASDYSKRRHQE